jgi:hypothetical protein
MQNFVTERTARLQPGETQQGTDNEELAKIIAEVSPVSYEAAMLTLSEGDGRPLDLAFDILRDEIKNTDSKRKTKKALKKLRGLAPSQTL